MRVRTGQKTTSYRQCGQTTAARTQTLVPCAFSLFSLLSRSTCSFIWRSRQGANDDP